MYEMKTLLPQFDIQIPKCMYNLKNVNLPADAVVSNNSNDNSRVGLNLQQQDNCYSLISTTTATKTTTTAAAAKKTSSINSVAATAVKTGASALDLNVLAQQIQQILKRSNANDSKLIILRQDKVLQQLQQLKAQLAEIRSTLHVTNGSDEILNSSRTAHSGTGKNGGLREEPLHDVVINGHPNFIPYALLAMKNAWRHLFTIDVKTFTHSTMSDIGKEALEFEQKLRQVPVDESKPKINVTLIWKNCEHTEMISSPTMYVPIYGEVNIIRYLGRIGPAEYRYEDSPLCNEIDAVLDICYQLLRCTTAKGRANMLRALNNRLQKQQYFGGEMMSVADIGVHSSLKRMPAIMDKDLTPTLSAWRKRAQLVTGI